MDARMAATFHFKIWKEMGKISMHSYTKTIEISQV